MRVVVSSSHLVPATARGVLPLPQCGVLPTGDGSPWTPPKWIHPMSNSPPQSAVTVGHSSMGCRSSGTARSGVGPHQGHKSCQETSSSVGSCRPPTTNTLLYKLSTWRGKGTQWNVRQWTSKSIYSLLKVILAPLQYCKLRRLVLLNSLGYHFFKTICVLENLHYVR